MKDIYLHIEDEYGYGIRIDTKRCGDDEVRMVIDGHEFYASRADRWKIVRTLLDSLESE